MSFSPFGDRNPPFPGGFGSRDAAFERIVKEGNYYFPAWKHYREGVNVVCDRCARVQLSASIGYADQDLCLNCAELIGNQMRNRTNPFGGITQLSQIGGSGKFPPDMMTDMMPSSHFPKVEDDDDLCTFMMVDSHFPSRPPPGGGFTTRMAVSSAFPRGLTTNMEVSQAKPRVMTKMESSHANPDNLRGKTGAQMEVSCAYPR